MKLNSTVMLVAAEPSADLYGSLLIREIRRREPGLSFLGIGGPRMQQAGVEIICRMEDLAVIGLTELIGRVSSIRRAYLQMISLLIQKQPALLILIDYPGFNLLVARKAKALGIPVMYYIAPQIWAWWRSRARQIARWVSKMVVVLPFEAPFFAQYGIDVEFVGHPLLDVVETKLSKAEFCARWAFSSDFPLLGLLPGSRKEEVERLLPVMVATVKILNQKIPGLQVAVSKVEGVNLSIYQRLIKEIGLKARVVEGFPYEVMAHSDLLLVASGTATLEAAILGAPMLILYKVAPLSYLIGKKVVRVSNIGLVNIVADKQVIPEFIQNQARPEKIAATALEIFRNRDRMRTMRQQLAEVKRKLGPKGATERAAEIALEMLDSRKSVS